VTGRTSYYHGDDPNRYFPAGDADATRPPRVQEVIDRRLFDLVADSADALVSLHTSWVGSASYVIQPRVTYGRDRTEDEADALATRLTDLTAAFGLPVVNQYERSREVAEGLHRSLSGAAVHEAGIPAFTPELGGRYVVEDDARRYGVEGLKNVARALGIVDEPARSEPQLEAHTPSPRKRAVHPHTDTAGIVQYRVREGDVVDAGEPIADVVSPHGERKATVRTEQGGARPEPPRGRDSLRKRPAARSRGAPRRPARDSPRDRGRVRVSRGVVTRCVVGRDSIDTGGSDADRRPFR
jgi:predicted deacylase